MPPIPHSLFLWLNAYAAPLLALAGALAAALLGRRKSDWVPAGAAIAALAGWALLTPLSRLPQAALHPRLGPELLLMPALGCAVGVALLHWSRRERWIATGQAAFAGWWVAQAVAGPEAFWRVWVLIGLLTWVVSRLTKGEPARGLACGLALWGGLVAAGGGPVWAAAALVAAATWAGLLPGKVGLPSAAMAALIGAIELAGGRAMRGRLGVVDLACLLALAAPPLAAAIEARWGKRLGEAGPAAGAIVAALGCAAGVWILRRAVFT